VLDIQCNLDSTGMSFDAAAATSFKVYYDDVNNIIKVPPLICSAPACCLSLTWELFENSEPAGVPSGSLSLHPATPDLAVSFNSGDQMLDVVVPNDAQAHFFFYIRVLNEIGYADFTPQIDVQVIYNCAEDAITLKGTAPTTTEIPELDDPRLTVISEEDD